ncbi:polycystin-1-like protein 2 [Anableps anableps]
MCWAVLHMLVLLTLCCQPSVENDVGVTASCPQDQRAFRGSCLELVGQQLPFYRAEERCEESGGHLAYIPDKETQNFLERHLDPEKDLWLGLAPSCSPKRQFSVCDEGPPLSWLDGSPLTFSKWVSSPPPDAACGYILRRSGFHWEATKDCNKNMHFICQFEPARRIVCLGHNTTLQCGSGQVLMIDRALYGRNNIHYCRTRFSTPTFTQHGCSQVDVVASIKAHCQEHQICRISEVMSSFDDFCPEMTSYLTVDYHCKDVITLSVPIVAAAYDDITIKINWHAQTSWGNCKLKTGDGHTFHLHGLNRLKSSVVHKYTRPSAFVVALECTDSERNITAQEIITIEEPVAEIGAIRCFAGNVSFYETNCRALHGGAFQIQIEVKAGTNVAYRIQINDRLLAGLHGIQGNVSQNITLSPETVKQLGPGCHKLTLHASNSVTFPEASSDLQVCVLEELAGLQASLLKETDDCFGSACITLEVSLDRGQPVLLLISLTGDNGTFSDTREMNTSRDIFQISHQIQVNDKLLYKKYIMRIAPSTDDPEPSSDPETQANTTEAQTSVGAISTSRNTSAATHTTTVALATTRISESLSCVISPSTGTILDAFSITCTSAQPCSNCQYCFKTEEKHLLCSRNREVRILYLPLGDTSSENNLLITATAKNGSFEVSTTLTAQVLDATADSSSVGDLDTAVENAVAKLKSEGLLSGDTIGEIFNSVAGKLNTKTDESEKEDRQELREKMLDLMTDTVNESPTKTPEETQVVARGLTSLIQKGEELSLSAQIDAATLFASLSLSILDMNMSTTEDKEEVITAASIIVEGVGELLEYSSSKNISDALLDALSTTQDALLKTMTVNEGPTIIQQPHISLFVNRVTPESLHKESISVNLSSQATFYLPQLPSDMFSSEELVNVRMLSLDKNPFSWNKKGNISGLIGGLSLTRQDGSIIPVENLSEDIEILLPRPSGEQVNSSILDLGNFSTTAIEVPSADSTLLLKMVPSVDPLPFKLFLGYMDYPTDTNYVAMTEMPLPGTTQEERYTWLISPTNLKGNTGLHYLVVRPIVGPGVKSVNASLSITPITSSCKFWNETLLNWNVSGCRVGVKTTHLVTQCLCNHLTFFGSSFFVTPNLVDPSRTAELFSTFAENPVVVCFVGALFVTYLLVVVWARRKDIKDTVKVKGTVLEDNDPMDNYRYLLCVCTGHRIGASTSSQVVVTLMGADRNSKPHHLTDPKKPVFERGAVDLFLLTTFSSLGELQGIRLWHNNSGSHPAWFVGNILVQDLQTEQKWYFLCNSWLAIDMGDCCLDKHFPVSTQMDLKKFSNLFFMKTARDFSDGHLWYSVISRPPSSTFTCVQRVSCCFSLLLCTMLTSIMFYGIPTDPSEQVMDLGHFEFTWQQFMVGVQSSLIMFPINILIVSIFRNTRPRETSCCQSKTKKTSRLQRNSSVQTPLQATATIRNTGSSTLDIIIKDIARILQSLSETTKCNIPSSKSEFGLGKETDINAVLTEVEECLKQNTKCSNDTQTKTLSPLSAEGIQKNSNKTQHLYRQICHLEKELSLIAYCSFPSPHSFDKAQQQVQGMKTFLEDQLFTSSLVDQHEHINEKFVPEYGTSSDGVQKKKPRRQGVLPWWFIFVGWLLVIGTSVVSGYFTMLYGLKFGKERSISWLVSMIVSFFQSLLFIQPLKVICLAVFFALVIKRVDEEDFQNVAFERNEKNSGDQSNQQPSQWGYHLYEPPPPSDIERMKRNKIMEQKAFALLNEILIYMGFMWMLLLVAYGQRDPNAFFLKQHIRDSFAGDVPDSMTLQDVFTWANTTLLQNLFGEYPGFITDGNSKLVGNARVRQLRVQQNSCQIASLIITLVPDCCSPYSWEIEDRGSYEPGWNHSVKDNISTSTSSPWTYQTEAELRTLPVWGRLVLYRGGGFVADLGPDFQNASSTLEYLFHNKWLDKYTRAIFVEFTVYNANVNLFCIVTFLMETSAVGAFQFYSDLQAIRLYPSTGGLYFFVMTAEIIYLLFILYYMFKQAKLLRQHRWLYFKNKWNLLELSIILLSWSAVAVFIQRTLLGNRDMTYYQNHKDQFPSFYETAAADSVLQYLVAFLVLLSTVKMWHLFRLNPKMNLITAALHRAWNDISSFLLIIVITLVAYSVASNVIYGWKIYSYKTFLDSLLTIISLQMGIFNYDEVLDNHPVLGGLLFGSCIVFMTFVVLNLFISVILVSLNMEQMHHKPSEEEEIVDLLVNKLCNLFGIRYKSEKDPVEPDEEGSSNLALNNSKHILADCSEDASIYQKSDS